MIRCAIPTNTGLRMSSDSVWPLRRANGTRWCDPADALKATAKAADRKAGGKK